MSSWATLRNAHNARFMALVSACSPRAPCK
jgi:hypothetical protein